MAHLKVPKAYEPLYQPSRYKVYWGGRGGAKSWQFADAILILADMKPLKVLCCREIQKSIKESVHSLLDRRIKDHELHGYTVLNNEIRHANGSQIIFEGLWQNIDSIKSIDSVDVCWVEEANTVSEASWKKLIPSIRKSGSEIWATFNPELKSDAAYQRFILNPPKNAVVQKVSWRDNPWFSQEMRDEMEHLKATDEDEYNHVWEGELKEFADGAIYAKQLRKVRDEGRISFVPVEPTVEVNTFWDLGKGDATAIWFHQRVGKEDRFIDYLENTLVDLDWYIKELKSLGYNYGEHFLPHDVEAEILGLGNKTRKEMLEGGGIRPIRVVPRIRHIEEGIEMTRKSFASCWFHQGDDERGKRIERGMECLQNYHYEYDDKRSTYRPVPVHDWASDGSDAFRQFGQGYRPGSGWKGQAKKDTRRGLPNRITKKSTTNWVV